MRMFKKKQESPFFEEDSLDNKFDDMMSWLKGLSRKDYNKVKRAMDKDYDAYQILHGIEPEADIIDTGDSFMLSEKEGE